MHTLGVIVQGLILLAVFVLVTRLATRGDGFRQSQRRRVACQAFIATWLVLAAINLWIGVADAGHSWVEEAPIFFVVFAVPAGVALLVARRSARWVVA